MERNQTIPSQISLFTESLKETFGFFSTFFFYFSISDT